MRYNENMLTFMAMADTYASCVEFVDRGKHSELYTEALSFKRYLKHPDRPNCLAGSYSDDTQMSIAVAEVLLQYRYPTKFDFVKKFYEVFKRDYRDAYSRPFQRILETANSPEELQTLITPNSKRNGAAMRSVPIGVLQDPQQVVEIAALQAATTHDTVAGINSSIAVALMSHYALHNPNSLRKMGDWCVKQHPVFELFDKPWSGPVKGSKTDIMNFGIGINTAWAVHTLLTKQTSLMDMLRIIIEWGGDTDSVAAIAWGIGSSHYGSENIPRFMIDNLERAHWNVTYGYSYLIQLSQRLMGVKKL